MFYWFLKLTLPLFLRVFYRRIHLSGIENIPKDKPVFIAANHSNSFLDGVMVLLLLRKKVFALARGDVFRAKWADFVLRQMNLLPIYRQTDGDLKENIRRNNELADVIFGIFKKGGVVLIFSESIARCEKRLRPLKKGTARMAFDMEQRTDFNLGMHIVPAGINYTYFKGYRKELMINFGPAISVSDWKERYERSDAVAVAELTDEISKRVSEQVVQIKDPDHDHLVDTALNIQRELQAFPFLNFFNRSSRRLVSEISLAERLNEKLIDEEDSMKKDLVEYVSLMKQYSIDERSFNARNISSFNFIWAVLLTIPALIGYVFFGWIYVFSWNKSLAIVKRDEFFDSVLFGISFILSFVEILVISIVLIILFGWYGVVAWVMLILCGFSFLAWKGIIRNFLLKRKWKKFERSSESKARSFLELRANIISRLEMKTI